MTETEARADPAQEPEENTREQEDNLMNEQQLRQKVADTAFCIVTLDEPIE